jgi:hypothetical protein
VTRAGRWLPGRLEAKVRAWNRSCRRYPPIDMVLAGRLADAFVDDNPASTAWCGWELARGITRPGRRPSRRGPLT